jgi:hypothetical protein
MAANTSPIFTLTPHIGMVAISTANTNRDGSGTLGSVITGTTNGTHVSRITVQATASTTAGFVRLYIFDGGSVTELWKEIAITAATPSGTVAAFAYTLTLTGETALVLPNGYILKASTHNAEAFNVIAEGGDY